MLGEKEETETKMAVIKKDDTAEEKAVASKEEVVAAEKKVIASKEEVVAAEKKVAAAEEKKNELLKTKEYHSVKS